ncbi:hypothetical protein ACIPVK_15425 [Paeniglutamicibacter sp. MACA_103]|uniref:hypothetical protein n=1 Tax=Paeniglutamicibacter sp. MACA_103 TaxID=3377337 RepID=UPI0038942267
MIIPSSGIPVVDPGQRPVPHRFFPSCPPRTSAPYIRGGLRHGSPESTEAGMRA